MASNVIKFSAILMCVVVCAADVLRSPPPPVTEACLGCMCQTASGCKEKLRCEDNMCGLFRIGTPYWTDAGQPTMNGEPVDSPTAFNNCAFDPYCAARTVQGYMRKFARDCNGDGQVNCFDYMAIHKMGPYGCLEASPPSDYVSVFNQCMASISAQQD